MDLKVNSISFNGKKEILYGLNKASKLAQAIEFSKTSYKDGIKREDGRICVAAMCSYLDMVTKDSIFSNTAKIFTQKELQPVKDNLKELSTQYGTIKPYDLFKNALENIVKKERRNYPAKRIAANELLELLA